MSTTHDETEITGAFLEWETEQGPVAADTSAKLRSRVYFGFAATMALSLALAGWYLGGRIFAAEQSHTSTAEPEATRSPLTSPAPPPLVPQSADANASATLPLTVVEPLPARPVPKLFLEVAGLGPEEDAKYVRKMEARGFHARIQAGADNQDDEDRRILIGPFLDRQELVRAQRKLAVTGVLALEREQ